MLPTAYEVLSDDTKRNKYDLNGEEGLKENAAAQRNPFGFDFFGGGESEQNKHLPHQVLPLEASLEDLYNGRTLRVCLCLCTFAPAIASFAVFCAGVCAELKNVTYM